VVVQPQNGGLLTPWQKRVALWFLIAFGITAPVGWLFARRLSRPLDRFADAAAQLGRDPSVVIAALDGPAEIGRAAHAFNVMQQRLRSFVDDRTAMVGAISHDLRTPLTRMRFRVEDAPDDIRGGMLQEVDDMEEMITSVLAFIRDAATPGVRERLDLKTLLDDVAEDVAVIGAEVPVAADSAATVEVEVMGMRRVFANLVENALKYGKHARIELRVSQDEAIAVVIDDGPGLPDEELEQVFQPFYRTASARASGAPGTGLGLAVCRSIARAHGGDVRLYRSNDGFRAEVRVPLAFDAVRVLAA
jgi:signal transduction histidine kinase